MSYITLPAYISLLSVRWLFKVSCVLWNSDFKRASQCTRRTSKLFLFPSAYSKQSFTSLTDHLKKFVMRLAEKTEREEKKQKP